MLPGNAIFDRSIAQQIAINRVIFDNQNSDRKYSLPGDFNTITRGEMSKLMQMLIRAFTYKG